MTEGIVKFAWQMDGALRSWFARSWRSLSTTTIPPPPPDRTDPVSARTAITPPDPTTPLKRKRRLMKVYLGMLLAIILILAFLPERHQLGASFVVVLIGLVIEDAVQRLLRG